MDEKQTYDILDVSHLTILISYTIFSVILIGESLLLSWEKWMIPLIAVGVGIGWFLHITQKLTEHQRAWLYSILMMFTFFFYGIHETSIYDLAPVTAIVIMIFSMTGIPGLVWMAMGTYYVTVLYYFLSVLSSGNAMDALQFTRTLLHLALVYMAGRIAFVIMGKWEDIHKNYDARIRNLEDENRRTEDFLANVSHELRTPINAVSGLTSVLLKKEDDEGNRSDLISIQNAGHRLAEQIRDILDYTEIDTKRIRTSEENYRIASLASDLLAGTIRDVSPECELILDLDAELPEVLFGDADKIKRVLGHLIGNGLKFTKRGGVYARIYHLPKPYGINLCMEVTDTGIGMTAEEIGKMRRKFYQADSSRSRSSGGLGLGLPIANGLTRAMGGFLHIESVSGAGTTVRVSIPQKIVEAAPTMFVERREELCLACYLNTDRFDVPRVRDFYSEMIANLERGLNIPLLRATARGELNRILETYRLTHLFLGQGEYESDPDFFETLDLQIQVVVIADRSFAAGEWSRARILRKPLCSSQIANILNSSGNGAAAENEEIGQMYCPGLRTLVVDDEQMNLVVAEGIFRNYGMSVATAQSGAEALGLCEREDFGVIFMDHMMPEMDGVEAMKRLRAQKRDKQLLIIALTANAVSGAKEMFLAEGFDGFIPKPIETTELERVLKRVLPRSAITYGGSLDALAERGIDTAAESEYCGGDRALYAELLSKFAQGAEALGAQLQDAHGRGEAKRYRALLGALRGSAALIGAKRLAQLAGDLQREIGVQIRPETEKEHRKLLALCRSVAEGITETGNS